MYGLSVTKSRKRCSTWREVVCSLEKCGTGCLHPSTLIISRHSLGHHFLIGGCRADTSLGTARRKGFDSLIILGAWCL